MKIKPMLFGIIASGAAVVGAQSVAANTWGVTVDVPLNSGTRVGAIVHLSPHLALSPGVYADYRFYEFVDTLSKTKVGSSGAINDQDVNPTVTVDLGVDYYFTPHNRVSLFAGGLIGYGFGSYREQSGSNTVNVQADDNSSFSLTSGVRIGGRYMLTERFGLYARAGFYLSFSSAKIQRQNESTNTITVKRTTTLLRLSTLATPIGVIFYF